MARQLVRTKQNPEGVGISKAEGPVPFCFAHSRRRETNWRGKAAGETRWWEKPKQKPRRARKVVGTRGWGL